MSTQISFSDYFKTSIKLIELLKVDYLIVGGIAAGVWGNPRLTEDIDIIIFISKKDFLLLKVIAGRLKDMLDAEGVILRQKSKLDIKYIEYWAKKISDEAENMRIYNDIKRLLKK